MNDIVYFLITDILDMFLWDGELLGEEHLQEGPGVLVSNHLGAIGPIGICCSIPVRLYPWIRMETVDEDLAPNYLRLDFVEKELKLKPPLSMWIAKAISKITIPIFHSMGVITTYRTLKDMGKTFSQSLSLLLEGKYLYIAPEDPALDPDPIDGIRPFQRGFPHLGRLYAERTGRSLPFYPVTIHEEAGVVVVDEPLFYNPHNNPRKERKRLINLLATTIKHRYAKISEDQSLTPQMIEEIIK
jgi:hypothetical protein